MPRRYRSAYIRSSYDRTTPSKIIHVKQITVPAACIKEQGEHTGIPAYIILKQVNVFM